MAKIENKIVYELNILKREVMKKYDKKEITEKEYKKSMGEVTEMLSNELDKEMTKEKNRIDNLKPKEDIKKMTEKVVKEKPVKKVKAPKEPKVKKASRQDIILKALSLKTINTVDKVVAKVIEMRPEDAAKQKDVKVHVNWTIGKLKKQFGRFAKYNFNAESLELTEKTE